jgi:hypothetical protein
MLVCLMVGCRAIANGEPSPSVNSLSLHIAAAKGTADSICIEARLCNIGTTSTQIVPLLIPQDYFIAFEVFDQTGRQFPFIGAERRVIIPDKVPLDPGACFSESFGLKSMFKVPASGFLTVKARYWNDIVQPTQSTVRLESKGLEVEAARLGTSESCTSTGAQRLQ